MNNSKDTIDPTNNDNIKNRTPLLREAAEDKTPPAPPVAGDGEAAKLTKISPLDWSSFPDKAKGGNSPPTTLANVRHLLASAGIAARYNFVTKKTEITVPDHHGTQENADNVAMTHVLSLAASCGLSTGLAPSLVDAIADENAYNPAADWINSEPWDGVDRLPAIYGTLTTPADYPAALKRILVHKWLLSASAAALTVRGFRCRGVLTLQGPQGIGKTQWVQSLVPDPVLAGMVLKIDHHLDAQNKDSVLGACCSWICEIGELDSIFKRDLGRIKGILTRNVDKVRRPYARLQSEYPRRTVFAATVNQHEFLVDDTGNSRWWVIQVEAVDYNHGISMQQLFAQLAVEFHAGGQWWLTAEEEELLDDVHQEHRTLSAVAEKLMMQLDLRPRADANLPALTPTQVLEALGIEKPTNPQCRECGTFLREHLGPPKRIQGLNKWRVAFRRGGKEEEWDEEVTDPSEQEVEEDPSEREAEEDPNPGRRRFD